jgi:hypothetical protein
LGRTDSLLSLPRLRYALAAGELEGGVGGGEDHVPFGGEGGAFLPPPGVGGAVDSEGAAGEADVAGLAERGEEGGVLALLRRREGTMSGHA